MLKTPTVLFEDNHLLVVGKPPGLATMGVQAGSDSLVTWAADYLKKKYHKPGNVYVGVVSRLDAWASGVLVLARTSKAAGRLSEQIRQQTTGKRYLAWVEGAVESTNQPRLLEDHLIKNESQHRMEIVKKSSANNPRNPSQLAQLKFRMLTVAMGESSVLDIELLTGRKHQIRVQLANLGHPLVGDVKYGAERTWNNCLGLHCYQNIIEHPITKERMSFFQLPEHWQEKIDRSAYAKIVEYTQQRQAQAEVI